MKMGILVTVGTAALALAGAWHIASLSRVLDVPQKLNPRYEVISITAIPNGNGRIVVVKDTVTQACMATYLYEGVMSWNTPCDQAEFDLHMQRQMERMMQQMQAPSVAPQSSFAIR
jgi:hypothetical protein